MTFYEESALQRMFSATLARIRSKNINESLAFGTILGQARHGRRMPWDDDLDIMIHELDQHAFVSDLPLYQAKRTPWCNEPLKCNFKPPLHSNTTNSTSESVNNSTLPPHCCSWVLTEDIIITWKPWGMPYKITPNKVSWPCIDVNTFFVQRDTKGSRVVVPQNELASGHVKRFDMPAEAILPLRPVHFFGEDTYVPRHIDIVLSTLWGPRWAVDCAVTYNHHGSANLYGKGMYPGLENAKANRFVKIFFPCKFMPESYHGDFMDGQGLERFGYKPSKLLPYLPLQLAEAFVAYDTQHSSEMIRESQIIASMSHVPPPPPPRPPPPPHPHPPPPQITKEMFAEMQVMLAKKEKDIAHVKGQVAEKDQEITKEKKKIAKMIAEMHILCVILLLCIACWVGIGCWMVKKRQVDNHKAVTTRSLEAETLLG